MRTLITGFGPFGAVTANPSQALAEASGYDFQILEVAYGAVDRFVANVDTDRLLMLGVASQRAVVSLELMAHPKVGDHPDVLGVVGPQRIAGEFQSSLAHSLWAEAQIQHWSTLPDLQPSHDAGDYLCNYIFYQIRSCRPDIAAAFLHVVPFEQVSFERQLAIVRLVTQLPEK